MITNSSKEMIGGTTMAALLWPSATTVFVTLRMLKLCTPRSFRACSRAAASSLDASSSASCLRAQRMFSLMMISSTTSARLPPTPARPRPPIVPDPPASACAVLAGRRESRGALAAPRRPSNAALKSTIRRLSMPRISEMESSNSSCPTRVTSATILMRISTLTRYVCPTRNCTVAARPVKPVSKSQATTVSVVTVDARNSSVSGSAPPGTHRGFADPYDMLKCPKPPAGPTRTTT
mmetsp:Transcript_44576/g.108817  ORF Transcript_44576/g.108817 Transcript_44576/m.108817 type:complete len:236 (-) Transcript_44576:37-744(-)